MKNDDHVSHSAKGSTWNKPTKYIKKVGDKYYYEDDLVKESRPKNISYYKSRYGKAGTLYYAGKTIYDNRDRIAKAVKSQIDYFKRSDSSPKKAEPEYTPPTSTEKIRRELPKKYISKDGKLLTENKPSYSSVRNAAKNHEKDQFARKKKLTKKSKSKVLTQAKKQNPEKNSIKSANAKGLTLRGVRGSNALELGYTFIKSNKKVLGEMALDAAKKAKKLIKKGKKAVGGALVTAGNTIVKANNDWTATREERRR